MEPSESLNLATLNVRGLSSKRRQSQVYRLLTDLDVDVLAVQETKVEGDDETGDMVRRFTSRYFVCVSHAVGSSAGCLLFVKKLSGLVVKQVFSGLSGRLVIGDVELAEEQWRFICLYAPNDAKERTVFFSNVRPYLTAEKRLVVLGDFNCVLSSRDKASTTPFRDESTALLSDIIDYFGLVDVGECLEGERDVKFTHFQGVSHARLDRVYVTTDLIGKCEG